MLEILLNPRVFLGFLAAFAAATPVAAWVAWRVRPAWRGRALAAVGGLGPAVLVLWGVHNLVLAALGFASIASAAVLLVLGTAIGWAAGSWIRADPSRVPSDGDRPS